MLRDNRKSSLISAITAIVVLVGIVAFAALQLNAREEFIENFVLLITAAGITGFLIPYILSVIDERKERSQKQFEDELARQNKIIDAQVLFLEDFAKLLWEFHALIAKVSYYKKHKTSGEKDETARANAAIEAYEDGFWRVVIVNIQAEVSKSRRLVSPQAHNELVNFYKHTINNLDQRLTSLISDNVPVNIWSEFHDETLKNFLVTEIDRILFMLAQDMGLVSKKSDANIAIPNTKTANKSV